MRSSRPSASARAVTAGRCASSWKPRFDVPELWRGLTPRQRALQLFGQFGVWDTAHNNGVLIYVLMADHDVEIVADRGIAQHVAQAEWQAVCRQMEHRITARDASGTARSSASSGVGALLGRHFPGNTRSDNELPNQPVLL